MDNYAPIEKVIRGMTTNSGKQFMWHKKSQMNNIPRENIRKHIKNIRKDIPQVGALVVLEDIYSAIDELLSLYPKKNKKNIDDSPEARFIAMRKAFQNSNGVLTDDEVKCADYWYEMLVRDNATIEIIKIHGTEPIALFPINVKFRTRMDLLEAIRIIDAKFDISKTLQAFR